MNGIDLRADDSVPAMRAVVVYDDAELAGEVHTFLERCGMRAGREAEWDIRSWPVELLRDAALAEEALVQAADVNLVVLVIRSGHVPPVWLPAWLESWAVRRRLSEAFLALVAGPWIGLPPSPLLIELRQLADRLGLRLLSQSELGPGPWEDLRQRERCMTSTLQSIMEQASQVTFLHHPGPWPTPHDPAAAGKAERWTGGP